MTEWMNERTNEWMNEWNEWSEWSEMKELMIEWIEIKELKQNEWIEILPTSSSKSAPTETVFFNMFKWKSSSRYSPVRFGRPLSPTEPRNRGNRDPPSATTAPTLPEKMQGFAPESVFKPEFTRSRSLTLPNYLHDDAVAMMIEAMMWLPSWWES